MEQVRHTDISRCQQESGVTIRCSSSEIVMAIWVIIPPFMRWMRDRDNMLEHMADDSPKGSN